jgi:hypothetical protein
VWEEGSDEVGSVSGIEKERDRERERETERERACNYGRSKAERDIILEGISQG